MTHKPVDIAQRGGQRLGATACQSAMARVAKERGRVEPSVAVEANAELPPVMAAKLLRQTRSAA